MSGRASPSPGSPARCNRPPRRRPPCRSRGTFCVQVVQRLGVERVVPVRRLEPEFRRAPRPAGEFAVVAELIRMQRHDRQQQPGREDCRRGRPAHLRAAAENPTPRPRPPRPAPPGTDTPGASGGCRRTSGLPAARAGRPGTGIPRSPAPRAPTLSISRGAFGRIATAPRPPRRGPAAASSRAASRTDSATARSGRGTPSPR